MKLNSLVAAREFEPESKNSYTIVPQEIVIRLLFKSFTVTIESVQLCLVIFESQMDFTIVVDEVGKNIVVLIASAATLQEDWTSILNEKLVPEPITVIK